MVAEGVGLVSNVRWYILHLHNNWSDVNKRPFFLGREIYAQPQQQPQDKSLQPLEDTAEVEADGGHLDVETVTRAALEMVFPHAVVGFHVADHGLDC